MTALTELIKNVRYKLVDPDKNNFSDDELMVYLNEAHRALHMIVAQYRPELITVTDSNSLTEGGRDIPLTREVLQGLKVRVNESPLDPVNFNDLPALDDVGVPCFYWMSGFQEISIHPFPDKAYGYRIDYVPAPDNLSLDGESPWPASYDAFLIEFTVTRAGMRDEADMSQEASFMQSWQQKIISSLVDMAPGACILEGYW